MDNPYSSDRVRRLFLEFFEERGHERIASAPLIPKDDPTLLFVSAGMVPFKPYYLMDDPPVSRAVSVQRCLRLSDLDEVGRTPYHETFFEMLGNFSFGDYFKKETIEWAWEFVTDVLNLPVDRLWVTVHHEDEAAGDIWRTRIGFPRDRIVPLGDKHNFWGPAGDSGACGPCSEIHYDMGEGVGCGRADCDPGCDCDRFFEIWNLVFPQYMQRPDGTREPLKRPGIDTGMGFERLCTVLQGASSVFETDVFRPIVEAVCREVEAATGERPTGNASDVVVVADHARAATFAIAENILPSNEAHGYVIRRLVRRAVRRGLVLGITEPFLYRLSGTVIGDAGSTHPHLTQKREHIALVLKAEEERFHETLSSGTASLEEAVEALSARGETVVPGELVFKLYDTYGFPVDLTSEMAGEKGLSIDMRAFEAEMEKQKARGRSAAAFGGGGAQGREWRSAPEVAPEEPSFVEQGTSAARPEVLETATGPVMGDPVEARVRRVRPGAADGTIELVLSRTPFYTEAGGQVADTGEIRTEAGSARVVNVYTEDGESVHVADLAEGELSPGEPVKASVDRARRRRVAKNHTATHLLQAALRRVLGDHVHQSGSWVGPDRLRFDFTHFSELSRREAVEVERLVNAWIRADLIVAPERTSLDDALARGAMALFGEKYGDDVRVVCVRAEGSPDVSLELCGGTHVTRTGEIGAFTIVSEASAAAGTRRIEAVTGRSAVERSRTESDMIRRVASSLKTTPDELEGRVLELAQERARVRKQLSEERKKAAREGLSAVAEGAGDVDGIRIVGLNVEAEDIPSLREQADTLREKLGSGVGVLGAEIDGAAVVVAVVTDDLSRSGRIRAGDVVREVASMMGGRGGGKPHLAQGGGDAARLDEALQAVADIVRRLKSKGV
jgi:alanyl-tRNA synthetase